MKKLAILLPFVLLAGCSSTPSTTTTVSTSTGTTTLVASGVVNNVVTTSSVNTNSNGISYPVEIKTDKGTVLNIKNQYGALDTASNAIAYVLNGNDIYSSCSQTAAQFEATLQNGQFVTKNNDGKIEIFGDEDYTINTNDDGSLETRGNTPKVTPNTDKSVTVDCNTVSNTATTTQNANVNINTNGANISVGANGANISAGGTTINTDGNSAQIKAGNVEVKANNGNGSVKAGGVEVQGGANGTAKVVVPGGVTISY